jgi:hypothetical protein
MPIKKRKCEVSSGQKAIIDLQIEKSKLNREKSMLVLNKALVLYFGFLLISILGFINGYIDRFLFNILILMGLAVLIIGIVPYFKTMSTEEKNINDMITKIKNNELEVYK